MRAAPRAWSARTISPGMSRFRASARAFSANVMHESYSSNRSASLARRLYVRASSGLGPSASRISIASASSWRPRSGSPHLEWWRESSPIASPKRTPVAGGAGGHHRRQVELFGFLDVAEQSGRSRRIERGPAQTGMVGVHQGQCAVQGFVGPAGVEPERAFARQHERGGGLAADASGVIGIGGQRDAAWVEHLAVVERDLLGEIGRPLTHHLGEPARARQVLRGARCRGICP